MQDKKHDIEILIATMHRNNLEFLKNMFPSGYGHLQLLIVNQTSKDAVLQSDSKSIKIINNFEKGLSKSRNLALEHATASICLFADDDIVFIEDFEKSIIKAFKENNVPVITFQIQTTTDELFWNYPAKNGFHKKLNNILSPEIAIKRTDIITNTISFNEHFGLGAIFEDSENYIFLKEVAKKLQMPYFYKKTIAIHPPETSSDQIASDKHLFARAALNYKFHKNLVYLWLIKMLFFLLRTRRISYKEIGKKWQIALAGIQKYKAVNHA